MEIEEFLKRYEDFQLGELPTEKPHPETQGLSQLAQKDLPDALKVLKSVDHQALKDLGSSLESLEPLKKSVAKTLEQGGNIYLCGCGATGRLSLLLESLWREKYQTDRVHGFMAGGDVALVHSLEGFEDYPELGEKHLREIGFGEKDLLIASSEGGETPYVIGATKAAAKISQQKAFFLYCNPTQDLADRIPRSKQIIENKNVNPIELFVGSMALSGSTRMQASTVLQLAIGWCLLEEGRGIPDLYQEFMAEFSKLDYQKLAPFIEKEHFIYTENEFVMYMPRQLALTVFTDSTERSPTFSLPAFENENFQKGATPSLSYILIPAASDKEEAWFNLIGRTPKALDWASDPRTGKDYLGSFDFSRQAVENREERLDYKRQYLFEIFYKKQTLHWSLAGLEEDWPISTESSIGVNTLLKLLLNTHSTLLMGKLGRYESNVMTWVKPTNGKLVDRAARYVQYLLKEEGKNSDYLEIVHLIYKHKNEALNQAPVVQRVLEEIRKK